MIVERFQKLLSGQFIRNVSWLGAAELISRIFRLGTTVILAHLFSRQDYGLLAVIYTTIDFANIFTLRSGIGAKIIQADERDVETICNTSYWLNWILCISVFIVQCIAAFPIAYFYKNTQLIYPLCTVALVYLILPNFLVQSALIERENRLKITALCNGVQSILSSIITLFLAARGMGIWAIVWAMVLTTPVWIVIGRINHSWRTPKFFTLERWREITNFGGTLLGVELLGILRWNIDYLIIGRFLGLEILGLYYFAFNAGLGISLSVLATFVSALLPYLCEVRGDINLLKERFFSSLKKTSAILIPVIILQAILVPFYVPIVFGQKWIPAIPLVVLLCLSALSFSLSRPTYILLNTVDKVGINLGLQLIYTLIFTISLLIAVQWGIFWVAVSVLISNIVPSVLGSIWAIRHVFNKNLFVPVTDTKL
ncbi:MAG: lipopolysaccharide biosynthesis protein [Desmonostoc vinosum HA7617-LM4]|nr:lipopolysaccharide biosynthesis protein [Desmonostoc vinosum HA7617-LM4]